MDFNHLTQEEKRNIQAIAVYSVKRGITNPNSQTGMLSVVGKETGFHLQSEGSYRNTPNARIRAIFGDRVKAYSDAALTTLKANDIDFFDVVYGYKSASGRANGNTNPGDGYKYRGHSYNQETYKNTFDKIGKQIGVDLVTNPDLANDPDIAAKVVVQYFINAFDSGKKLGKLAQYHSTGINDFTNYNDSLNAFYHANAGWGHSKADLDKDPTGGLAKARSMVATIYKVVSENKAAAATGGTFFFSGGDNSVLPPS